jgi:hypothetical protein
MPAICRLEVPITSVASCPSKRIEPLYDPPFRGGAADGGSGLIPSGDHHGEGAAEANRTTGRRVVCELAQDGDHLALDPCLVGTADLDMAGRSNTGADDPLDGTRGDAKAECSGKLERDLPDGGTRPHSRSCVLDAAASAGERLAVALDAPPIRERSPAAGHRRNHRGR